MHLSKLKLYNFRNIEEVSLDFKSGLNVIFGKNGQGKTNLVESIQILSTTKSFRTSKTKEYIKWGTQSSRIDGFIEDRLGNRVISVVLDSTKKNLFIDSNQVKAKQFVGSLVAVTFSPDDIEIIKGSGTVRRQFLDKHMVDLKPSYLETLSAYQKCLKSKLDLLYTNPSNSELDTWDTLLAKYGSEIVRERISFLQILKNETIESHKKFSSVDGEVELKINFSIDSDNQENFFNKLISSRKKDIDSKRASLGPHRDDLEILYNGINSRSFASQGQSKSLALSLKLGIVNAITKKREEPPIVVLDDVDSELDPDRLFKLYESILELPNAQTFITGTNSTLALKSDFLRATCYEVKSGEFFLTI